MATDRPDETFQVTILNSPVVNAFALPNGRLYVTRGLLALANDTSEIAAVLSHEIAHVTLRHASQRSELQARSALIEPGDRERAQQCRGGRRGAEPARASALASFSRAQELEADQAGVKVLARAGFDPFGAPRFLTALGRSGGGADGTRRGPADMLATHPSTGERVALALQAARRAERPGHRRDGPASLPRRPSTGSPTATIRPTGWCAGRRFIHARLGVAFEAPGGLFPGEHLPGRARSLRRRQPAPALRCRRHARTGRASRRCCARPGTTPSSRAAWTTTTVNGLPVATALSQRQGMVVPPLGHPDRQHHLPADHGRRSGSRRTSKGMFQRTLDSVRQVQPRRGAAIRPLQLRDRDRPGAATPPQTPRRADAGATGPSSASCCSTASTATHP